MWTVIIEVLCVFATVGEFLVQPTTFTGLCAIVVTTVASFTIASHIMR